MKPQPYTCYEAEVKIKDKSTLRPDANLKDGDIVKVQYGWIIEEQYDFAGQVAFLRKEGLWIPEEDLILHREISAEEYYVKTEDYVDCWRQKYNSSLLLTPMITRTKLIPVRIDCTCLKCEKGKMQRVRKHHMIPDHAPYLHECDSCNHQEELSESYPYIIYEETSL